MVERAVLVLDGGSELEEIPLALRALGLASLHAQDLEEPLRQLPDGSAEVGAVLVPADSLRDSLPALLERITRPLALAPAAVVPVGTRAGSDAAVELAKRGLRWALWRPFDARDLRFVVTQALRSRNGEEPRLHPRVPCTLLARLESPLRQARASLTDLSPGGCFAALEEGFSCGARVRVRCELSRGPVAIAGRVAWASGSDTPAWRDPGIGIEFLEIPDDARAILVRSVDERIARYRI